VASIAVSTPGDLLYSIALAAELYRRTSDARWLAAVAIVAPLGRMLLAPLGGDMADRYDRKTIMVACNVIRALIMFALTYFVLIEAQPILLVGCVLLSAIVATPQRAASAAIVPGIVDREDLAVANAADAVVQQTAWLLGPAIGAALTSVSGPAVAMFVNSLTFVAAAFCIARITLRGADTSDVAPDEAEPDSTDTPKGFVGRTMEGVAAIRTSKALRSVWRVRS
jgi:MFS family permease